jgi:hypothetical protein
VVFVKLLAHFRFRVGLEVFVDALVILVCASAICDLAVTRSEIVILEGCGKDRARLEFMALVGSYERVGSSYIISHLVHSLDLFGPEEVFERLLLLTRTRMSMPSLSRRCGRLTG